MESSRKITFHILVEEDEESGWLTGICPALPGCISQGATEDELLENMKEAILLWLEVEDEKHRRRRDMSGMIGQRELAVCV